MIEIDSIWFKRIELFSTLADLSSGVADIAHKISHSAFLDRFGVLALFL
jgi:hypothetical protein